MVTYVLWGVAVVIALLAIYSAGQAVMMSRIEEPQFALAGRIGTIELRDYPAMIVAEAETRGDRAAAINEGFRLVAGYIFGGNAPGDKIAMTAPVVQSPAASGQAAGSQKIAMTVPVIQQPSSGGKSDLWRVAFVMPAKYTMATLPKPLDARVRLVAVAPRRVAAIRFSGFVTDASLSARRSELLDTLAGRGIGTRGVPTFAFYNPPWTLPFLKRNEVLVEIDPAATP